MKISPNFQLAKDKNIGLSKGYFVFEHRANKDFLFVIEPNEISFAIYDHRKNVYKGSILRIPIDSSGKFRDNLELKFKKLHKSESDYQIDFPKYFKNFITDLYLYKAFDIDSRGSAIQMALESIPIIQAVSCKVLYDFKNNAISQRADGGSHIDSKAKSNIELPISNSYLNLYATNVNRNWIKVLTSPKNDSIFNSIDDESHWLDSRMLELDRTIRKLRKDDNYKNDIESKINISGFLLQKYELVKLYTYFTPTIFRVSLVTLTIILPILAVLSTMFHELNDIPSFRLLFSSCIILFLASPIFYFAFIMLYSWLLPLLEKGVFRIKRNLNRIKSWNNKKLKVTNQQIFDKETIENKGLETRIKLKKLNQKTNHRSIFPSLFIPRLTIAIISGWLVFLTAEELLKIDITLNLYQTIVISIILGFLLYVFMLSEVQTKNLQKASPTNIVFILLLGFSISYSSGFFIMSYISKQFLISNSFLQSKNRLKDEIFNNVSRLDQEIAQLEPLKLRLDLSRDDFNNIYKRVEQKYSINTVSFMIRDYGRINHNSRMIENEDFNYLLKGLKSAVKTKQSLVNVISDIDIENSVLMKIKDANSSDTLLSKSETLVQDSIIEVLSNQYKTVAKGLFNVEEIDSLRNIGFCGVKDIELLKEKYNEDIIEAYMAINELIIAMENVKIYEKKKILLDWDMLALENLDHSSLSADPIVHYHYKFSWGKLPIWEKSKYDFETYDLTFFPNLIFLRSIIALFIGIFVQLVLQDKSITEPI